MVGNRFARVVLALIAALSLLPLAARAQQDSGTIININIHRNIQTINYWARGSTKVDFEGTELMPKVSGQAKVESRNGALAITGSLKNLQSPTTFGSPFLVYVMWAMTPDGRVTNLGQVMLKGDKSDFAFSTRLQTFGLLITAEPYFAVTMPSDYVIADNAPRTDTKGAVGEVDAKWELLQRMHYKDANLPPLNMESKVPLDIYQAQNALRIAKWEQADKYAPETYQKAEAALKQAEDYYERKQKNSISTVARQSVQFSEDARTLSLKRQADEKLAAEQQAARDKAAADAAAREAALKQQQEAEAAAAASDAQRKQAEAQAAQESAARAAALQQQQQAEAAARQADAQRQQAEAEKQALRARLLEQFNRVLPTTDTPRGLVVNMGDVLFDTAKADLRQPAQIALARLAGVVSNYPSLHLDVQGYTDSTGTEQFNQVLSDKRAASVRDYLISQGLNGQNITEQGFGELNPVADNKTAAGRQKNRRVEIVISGEVIGHQIGAPAAATPPPAQ